MKMIIDYKAGLLSVVLGIIAIVSQAAPVPVTDFSFSPGFGPESPETNGQELVYIKTAAGWHEVAGVTCTSAGTWKYSGARGEVPQPTSAADALTGLKFTQTSLNIGNTTPTKCNLNLTITNDSIGVLVGELSVNATADSITIYPLLGGSRVGDFSVALVQADYGNGSPTWFLPTAVHGGTFLSHMTIVHLSDFTGTGTLTSFDGIELAGNTGYDPNIIATVGALMSDPVIESHFLPATGTFSPGFGPENPETNGQVLVSLTTSEGTFNNINGFTCNLGPGNYKKVYWAVGETPPVTTNESMSGLKFTQVAANFEYVDVDLGYSVGRSDQHARFFVSECGTSATSVDPITLYPLSNGERIGSWQLYVGTNDYGTASAKWQTVGHEDPSFKPSFYGHLVSFALSDFTNGIPATLTGVDGFRVNCDSGLATPADLSVFGAYETPKKGTIVIIN